MINILLTFIIGIILYPIYINFAKWVKFGQKIREQGPISHQFKQGVPTGGGIVFALIIIFFGLYYQLYNWQFWLLVGGYMALGLIDDISKMIRRDVLGLRAREKLLIQTVLLLPFSYYLYQANNLILLPGNYEINSGLLYLFWSIFIILATANAYNFLDGLDGLASGTGLIIFFFIWISYQLGYIQGSLIGVEIIIGSMMAFLWYNLNPARVIMGDAGAMFTGAYLAGIFLMDKTEVILPVMGSLLVITLLSVVIQVIYFKLTKGKRIFKMSPLHHHFELSKLPEVTIVGRYWILTFISCIFGLYLSRFL